MLRAVVLCCVLGSGLSQWTQRDDLREQTKLRVGAPPVQRVVNLDLPPKQRWAFMKSDPSFNNFKADFNGYITHYVPKYVLPLVTAVTGKLQHMFDEDYAQEMTGLAAALDLSIGEVVLINLIYQLEHLGASCEAKNNTGPCPPKASGLQQGPGLCTGLVAQGPTGDEVWQGRNLDWNLDANLLKYVIQVEYQRSGVTVFTGVQISGMVGVLQGVRNGAFSLQMNARDEGGQLLPNLLELLVLGAKTPSHHMRRSLESSSDYAAAEQFLSTGKLANPVYYIIAGAARGQGSIITRERKAALDVWHLEEVSARDIKKINTQPEWFRLQTNYDHWEPVPSYDDRRTPGVAHVTQMCNGKVDADSVMQVMTAWPTQNHHTDVTSIMCARTGYISTTVWLSGVIDLVVRQV